MMSIGSKFLQVIKDYSGVRRQLFRASACQCLQIARYCSVRPSVRLSVCPMPVLSDKQMDYISSQTFWQENQSIFSNPPRCKIQRGTPQRGRYIHRGGKFGKYYHLSLKWQAYQIDAWNTDMKAQTADRSVPVPMTSSDLERRNVRAKIIRQISITLQRFDPE